MKTGDVIALCVLILILGITLYLFARNPNGDNYKLYYLLGTALVPVIYIFYSTANLVGGIVFMLCMFIFGKYGKEMDKKTS